MDDLVKKKWIERIYNDIYKDIKKGSVWKFF